MELSIVLLLLSVLNFGLIALLVVFVVGLTRRNKDLSKRLQLTDNALNDSLAISIMNDAELCKRPWR